VVAVKFTSKEWSDKQAENKNMQHSDGKYGENLAMAGRAPAPALEITPAYMASAKAWYAEIQFWDFKSNKGNGKGVTGHFTQVVWKNSKQVHCGYAKYEKNGFNNYVVTCQYYPPGNFNNAYAENVGQLKSSTDQKTCKRPTVENAAVKPDAAEVKDGEKYEVSCAEGYKIKGTVNSFTCKDGALTPAAIVCYKPEDEKKTCKRPAVSNAELKPETATINEGEKYMVSCAEGYKIKGTVNTFTCKGDGTLTPAAIVCEKPEEEKKTCKRPAVSNASLKPETTTVNAGEKYTVSCNEGYKLRGEENKFTCKADGNLHPESIICYKPEDEKKTCKRPEVKNAEISPASATVSAGEKYKVTCNDGHKIRGTTDTFTCSADGKLTPAYIACDAQVSGVGKIALSTLLMSVVAVLFY